MKTILLLLLTASTHLLTAQDDFYTRWDAAYELVAADRPDEALAAFEPLMAEQPSYADTHVQMAWCYLLKGNMEEAGTLAHTAYQLDPLSAPVYAINSYFLYTSDMRDGGLVFLKDAIWFLTNDEDLQYLKDDVASMQAAGLNVTALTSDLDARMANTSTRDKTWADIQSNFADGVALLNQGDHVAAKKTFKTIFPLFDQVPEQQQRFAFNLSYVIGTYFYNAGDSSNYMPLLTKTYEHMKVHNKTAHLILLHISTLLGEHHYSQQDYARSFEVLSGGLDHFSSVNPYVYLGSGKAQFLLQYAASALAVGNMTEARDAARLVTELSYTGYDEWYTTQALIYGAQSWQAADENKAQAYYQKAYKLASDSGFEDLASSIAPYLK